MTLTITVIGLCKSSIDNEMVAQNPTIVATHWPGESYINTKRTVLPGLLSYHFYYGHTHLNLYYYINIHYDQCIHMPF